MINLRSVRPYMSVLAGLIFLSGVFSSIAAGAQQQQTTVPAARITQKINETSLTSLRGNTSPLALAKNDIGPAPGSKAASRLILVLTRSAAQEASLKTWLSSVQDANSPNYHQWLSPEEFGKRFGVSDADLATVQAWLQSHGFTVNKVPAGRTYVEFSGTTAQIETAFHTSIHSFLVNGVPHWSNTSDPQIPTALTPVVAGVAKLNDFNPRSNAVRGPSGIYNETTHRIEPSFTLGDATNGYTIFLGPADAATIYDTPTSLNPNHGSSLYDGTGVTIGIAGDSNIDVTQNANYRATFGLPAKPTTVVVDGADPGENGDAVEAYLDTEVASGIAPNANVILYTAADTYLSPGLFLAISRAIDDNQADVLNVSFGSCEVAQGTAANQYIYNLWQQAAAQGISVTVSTGDSGSAGCDNENTELQANFGLAVNALASTPYTIAVGGTDFDTLYGASFPASFTQYVDVTNSLPNHRSALKYIPERPWNDSTFPGDNNNLSANVPWTATQYAFNANIVAGGGGASSCVQLNGSSCIAGYPVPSWQSGVAASSSGRNLPDVSFLAGNGLYGAIWGLCTDMDTDANGNPITDCAGTPTTGNNFNLTGVGGTSASAPAFAAMLALVKQKVGSRLGQADYVLYTLAKSQPAVFHDVTAGNNSVACTAGSPGCQSTTNGYYFMSGFNAAAGFDEASGLGSVDVTQLASNWAGAGLTATTSSLTLNGSTAALSITHGASVAVSVGVTGSGGTPAGNVALVDSINPATVPNSGSIGAFTLSNGAATGTTTSLPGGSYNVSAHYGGSQTFAESDSNSIAVTVNPESSTTTLSVKGYFDPDTGNPSTTPYYGYIYLIDARPYGNSASASSPNGAATGTITFKSGTSTIGTAALASDGVAELQTGTVPAGNDSLTAAFAGDGSFQASTSSPVTLNVQPALTQMQLTTGAATYNVGAPVAMTATFVDLYGSPHLDSIGAAPTGTVTFKDGSTTLATVPVSATAGSSIAYVTGSAKYTASQLSWGSHTLSAIYNGDSNYAASSIGQSAYIYITGAIPSMTVQPASTTIKINQTLLVTATLGASGSLPVPTGTVTFTVTKLDMTPIYTSPAVAVSSGSASFTIPANTLTLGPVVVVAKYSGDSDYVGASSTAQIQVNSSGTVTPTVSLTLPTGTVNGTFPVTVTVNGPSGDPTPTGSVMITGSVFMTFPLVNGSANINYGFALPPGPNTLTATYLGDTTYTGGTATGIVNEIAPANLSFTPKNPTVPANQSLAVTVTVAQVTNVAVPTGTVTLSSGTFTSAATALDSGSATITIPADTFTQGLRTLTASYSGDANYVASTAGELVSVTAPAPPGVTLSGTDVTLSKGATTGNTSAITISPTGGFTGSVTLSAAVTGSPAGATDPPTVSFGNTSSVTISGTSNATATLTINTTAPSTASVTPANRPRLPWRSGAVTLACLCVLGIGGIRRRRRGLLVMLLLLIALAGGAASCGGSNSSGGGSGGGNNSAGTTAGSYTITVTATAGSTSATTTIKLVVN